MKNTAKRTTHFTYTNTHTKETYELGAALKAGETPLEAAWGRCFRTAEQMTGWHFADMFVSVAK